MKKIILNFEKKQNNFKELVQEAFNKDILDFIISEDTYSEFKQIERINLFSEDLDLTVQNYITKDKEKLEIIKDAEIIWSVAAPGIEVLSKNILSNLLEFFQFFLNKILIIVTTFDFFPILIFLFF